MDEIMSGNILIKVININYKGKVVKVATVEHTGRRESLCKNCSALCCQGIFRPVLTKDELLSRKFPIKFVVTSEWIKEQAPMADYIATLAVTDNGCPYFDPTGKDYHCKAFPDCPKGCLTYDCREDTRDCIKDFAQSRQKELNEMNE